MYFRCTLKISKYAARISCFAGMMGGVAWLGETPCILEESRPVPPDPVGLFSEGGEGIKLHLEGSLTIPKTEVKRV